MCGPYWPCYTCVWGIPLHKVKVQMLSPQQVTLEMVLKKLTVANGQWKPTGQAVAQWEGTCQRCGTVRAAVELRLKRLPFGRGEVWCCREGEVCDV